MRKIFGVVITLAAVCLPCGYTGFAGTETVDGYTYSYGHWGTSDMERVNCSAITIGSNNDKKGESAMTLPALWEGRNTLHVSGEPLVAAKVPPAEKPDGKKVKVELEKQP